MGRDTSRDRDRTGCGGNHEIVERGLRKFEGSRLALRLRGFDAAITQAVEMRARRGRRTLHAVMGVVSDGTRRVHGGQRAGTHGPRPSHCNGEGGRDDWLPIAHKEGRIRLSRSAVKAIGMEVR